MTLNYLSVCSGIEAASIAWAPLGFTPWAFSEIEPFPCAVIAARHGSNLPGEPLSTNAPPNLGDMTKFKEWPDAAIDVLVGGTPCQSFSVAGLRAGLADPRGNLCLTYLAILDRYRPDWCLWENVPGVLSSGDGRDFGAFLGGLGQLGYGFAYRVLDAQYVRIDGFGRAVPQRRRRVFVVGHSGGDWRRAAAVLFDAASLRGDSPPRRKAGERIAGTLEARIGGGGLGNDFDLSGGLAPTGSAVAHALRADGFDASEDGTGRGTPLVPVGFTTSGYGAEVSDVASTMQASFDRLSNQVYGVLDPVCFDTTQITSPANRSNPRPSDPCQALAKAAHAPAIAFDLRGRVGGAVPEGPHETANIRAASGGSSRSYIAHQWAVRRLTPLECERLQGFPDGYTDVVFRGKPAADGPRYKALGNSMAVNVMRWLGYRIKLVDAILTEDA